MKGLNLTQNDLHKIISLQKQLQRDREQLYMLLELAEGTGSVPTDNLRVQNSLPPSGNKYAVAAADLSGIIENETNKLKALQYKVDKFIETLPGPPQIDARIMQLRYIECYEWQVIIKLLGYTERHVFRIHNRVVESLPKMSVDVS